MLDPCGSPHSFAKTELRMNVLHIGAGNLFGGVESLLATLARHRDQCPEVEPHYALCFEGRLAAELRQAGVSVYFLGGVRMSRPWTVWRARRRLAGLSIVRSISSRSSWRTEAIFSGGPLVCRSVANRCFSSSMRREVSSSCRMRWG